MINYFNKRIFAKIALLFLSATLALIVASYYIFDWSFTGSDNILDAHDAYYHYKLVDSWGADLDTLLIKHELNNLHFKCAIVNMDFDTSCVNDSLIFWSNFDHKIDLCNYISYSDSKSLGERHDIVFPAYVSFGDYIYQNQPHQATLVINEPYQFLFAIDFVYPNRNFNFIPLVVLSFVFMFFLYLLVRRLLDPINLIERRIRSLEKGDLTSKIRVSGQDELGTLSANLNTMIADIRQLLNQKERLLSDVSHELRTPLAKIRLLLAMIPEHDKIEDVDKQIKVIDSLITNILLSDKMSTPYSNLNLKKIVLRDLIKEAVDMTFVKNVVCEYNKNENLELHVDVIKMSVAIKNLLENAYKYADLSQNIVVSVLIEGSFASLSVKDQGPGVDEGMIKDLAKPFVRGKEKPGSGFGLGLSICKKVVEAHGGSLTIQNNKDRGACFTLNVPI